MNTIRIKRKNIYANQYNENDLLIINRTVFIRGSKKKQRGAKNKGIKKPFIIGGILFDGDKYQVFNVVGDTNIKGDLTLGRV